jgi:hypothetical protein
MKWKSVLFIPNTVVISLLYFYTFIYSCAKRFVSLIRFKSIFTRSPTKQGVHPQILFTIALCMLLLQRNRCPNPRAVFFPIPSHVQGEFLSGSPRNSGYQSVHEEPRLGLVRLCTSVSCSVSFNLLYPRELTEETNYENVFSQPTYVPPKHEVGLPLSFGPSCRCPRNTCLLH